MAGRRETESPRRRPLTRLVVWTLTLGVWAALAIVGLVAYHAHDLPNVRDAMNQTRAPSVTFVARDGTRLATYGNRYGERVALAALPDHLPRAVMAAEDRRFYDHWGVDPLGLARAAYVNLRAWDIEQGGSTITQQLAKNLFLSPAQTLKRKVQELLLAFWLEHKFSKTAILERYLNRVYMGQGVYGVDAAARHYFGKPPRALTLYESAILAGMLTAPADYNPRQHPDAAHRRAVTVLNDMVDAGYIGAARARRAAQARKRGHVRRAGAARYFTDWAMRRVRELIGTPRRDIVVRTTLDPAMQRAAHRELANTLRRRGERADVGQGAVVTLSPGGAVRALVGGRSYAETQFNRATQARRQPGSAFKPFVYLAAMQAGMEPGTRMVDEPVTIDGWSPDNFSGEYHGRVTLREAFARSLNAVAVKVQQRVGPRRVIRAAQRLGITTDLAAHPSLALGTAEVTLLDLTGAYAVFANGGRDAFPHGVTRIRARDGEVLYRRGERTGQRLIGRRPLRHMIDLFHADIAWGTGQAAALDRPAGGKTGTSQKMRDAWFVGFTARLVTGVWLGNDDGHPMDGVTGGSLPAEIWASVMRDALEGYPEKPLPSGGTAVAAKPDEADEADDASTHESGRSYDTISRIIESLGGGSDDAPAASSRPGDPGH